MKANLTEKLWNEKYRPQTIEDCILPSRIKDNFESYLKSKDFPNLLLSGGAGVGKTTLAKALCNQLDIEYLFINASDERNIDVVRTKIKEFSSTLSISGKDKAVILDESDGLSPIAQGALRAAIEEFSNVKFILTCNFKNKLIDPLISRMAVVEFRMTKEEKTETIKLMAKRVLQILDKENVEYDSKSVLEVVKKYFPDNRKIINTLNQYGLSGNIDSGIIKTLDGSSIANLIDLLKSKDFKEARQWASDNSDMDMEQVFKELYEQTYNRLQPASRPEFCVIIAKYAYQSGIVVNQEINLSALLAEIITLEFI